MKILGDGPVGKLTDETEAVDKSTD